MHYVGLNMGASHAHFTTKEKRYLGDIEILDEHVLYQSGCFKRVKRWLLGKHPKLGVLARSGITGEWETIQETDVIMAMHKFTVEE
jgi:hypothetical protein